MTQIKPVSQEERISSLDALRGFALLGILPANIIVFGLYYTAGSDPTVAGGATGLNLVSWALMQILVQGKMRCLFSMVFGASAILLTSRAEERAGIGAADIYYRRNLWLLVFGLAHAFLLFWGDILYPYALCALILFPFRKLSAKKLLLIGALVIAFQTGAFAVDAFKQVERANLARAGDVAIELGEKPTDEEAGAKKQLEAQRRRRKPSLEELETDARRWRGNPLEVIRARADAVMAWHAVPYYDATNLDIWSMIFIGMGLYKLGMFSAQRSHRTYAWIAATGYMIGLPLNSYVAWLAYRSNFERTTILFTHMTYDVGRLSVALAHMAVLMMVCKCGALTWLIERLAAIGQTALSNYVLQSVICSFVFTGYGLAFYGRLERYQLYYVVALCWVVSLIASAMWLRRYRFGPLEWCWRSLTYWERQPMRLV